MRNHKKMHCEREPSTSYFCHCGPWKTILTDCTHTDTDTHTHTHNSVSQNPAHGRVYSIQHYVIQFVSDLWWGVLDTTLCDTVCQWLVVRCTRYNIMWYSLSVTCGEVYSIQHYVIQFVSDLWWGVLDTTLCDTVCQWLVVRCTRYNIMWYSLSVTCGRSVVFSIQHYVIQFVSDLWQVGGFLYTTLCDTVCQWLVAGRWFSLYNIMWYSLSVTCGRSVVFSIQHYVIQFVSDLWQVGGFLSVLQCSPPIKLKYHWKWR